MGRKNGRHLRDSVPLRRVFSISFRARESGHLGHFPPSFLFNIAFRPPFSYFSPLSVSTPSHRPLEIPSTLCSYCAIKFRSHFPQSRASFAETAPV